MKNLETATSPNRRTAGLPLMRTLISKDDVTNGICQLAESISDFYENRPLTIVGVLTGSVVFLADMIRQLKMPMRVGVVQASSYRGATKRGPLVINSDLMPDIAKHDVLVLDDIFDTGHTMVEILQLMEKLGPTSVRSAVLLMKKGQQQVSYSPDFVGFEIPNEFVVGYGLDYQDKYRNLPFVAALDAMEIDASADDSSSSSLHKSKRVKSRPNT